MAWLWEWEKERRERVSVCSYRSERERERSLLKTPTVLTLFFCGEQEKGGFSSYPCARFVF
ncbi:hypothetical protein Ahy_B04g073161 isoform D [Arachis hypogaea]|uniref:Uncharacterized protein n=1 Tax=Arachis hypogaea TaxID=3818 RepID=A0A444ZPY3_ARAHY|nr:hypothetical protein Ahy_B04g073161 isoform D [Arachis hypogaea]